MGDSWFEQYADYVVDNWGAYGYGKYGSKNKNKKKKGYPDIQLGKYDPEIVDMFYSNILDLVQGRGKEDIMGEAFLGPVKRTSGEAMREAGAAASTGAVGEAFKSEGTNALVNQIVGEELPLKEADIFSEASMLRQERLQEGLVRGADLYGKQRQLDLARKGISTSNEILSIQQKAERSKAMTGAAKMFLNKQVENKEAEDFMAQLAMMIAKTQGGV